MDRGNNAGGFGRRTAVVTFWGILCLGVLTARLVDIQVVQQRHLSSGAAQEHLGTVPLPATRGEITDSGGRVLAVSVPAAMVTADPRLITDPATEAAALAPILGASRAQIRRLLRGPGQYAVLAAEVSTSQAAAIGGLQARGALPGIYTHGTTVRRYPDGFFMGHLLGFVNAAGGAAGVELSYQKALAGANGYILAQVDPAGQIIPGTVIRNVPPKQGLTVRLTVDAALQSDLQQQLELAVATTRASRAFGIVLQPSSGAILAASAWPTYDPNAYWNAPATWANTVQGFDLPPGSVFKPITVSAALQSGIVTPDTPLFDPGVLRVDGAAIHNFTPLERHTTFTRAFEESANVVFGTVGLELGPSRFYRFLHAFGLLGLPGSDLPGEQPDIFVPQAQANPLAVAEESFGETLSVTPLSLITALNVIADGGLLVQPHVGLDLVDGNGHVVHPIEPVIGRRVIPASVAATVRQMMVGVVDNGTGQRGFIPCYDVAGKTGTANIYGPGGVTNNFIASFVGMAPAGSPAAIALVMIYRPQGSFNEGGEVAAPVVQAVLRDALHDLGVPPHCTAGNILPPKPGAQGTTSLVLDMVTMPAIANLPVAAATARVQASGLRLDLRGGGTRILRQDPPPGATVQKWTAVVGYTTPAQPAPASFVRVPDVLGQPLAAAAANLASAGFALEVTGTGLAATQNPPAGMLADPGSAVHVDFRPVAPIAGGKR